MLDNSRLQDILGFLAELGRRVALGIGLGLESHEQRQELLAIANQHAVADNGYVQLDGLVMFGVGM